MLAAAVRGVFGSIWAIFPAQRKQLECNSATKGGKIQFAHQFRAIDCLVAAPIVGSREGKREREREREIVDAPLCNKIETRKLSLLQLYPV